MWLYMWFVVPNPLQAPQIMYLSRIAEIEEFSARSGWAIIFNFRDRNRREKAHNNGGRGRAETARETTFFILNNMHSYGWGVFCALSYLRVNPYYATTTLSPYRAIIRVTTQLYRALGKPTVSYI